MADAKSVGGGGVGGWRGGEKRESGEKESESLPLPFPFLPMPYPFRCMLRRLIRVCHNLIVCAVCAKILKAGNFFSSIFCERFFLLFASPWLLLTDGDLLTAYSTLSSVFCKQLFIVYLTIVSFGDLLTTGLHQPMVSIGCTGLLGTIITILSRSVTRWLSWDKG